MRIHSAWRTAWLAVLLSGGLAAGSGLVSAQAPDTASAPPDTATRLHRMGAAVVRLHGRATTELRRGVNALFEADSMTSAWTEHQDPTSRFFRATAPAAFWIPPAMTLLAPGVWAEETQDRHAINAQYARAATQALVIGFIASRATKAFVHRARPCTGAAPDSLLRSPLADSTGRCPHERIIGSYASFFSEHTMAAFSVASAVAFEAQRRNEPRIELISAIGITAASFIGVSRLYSRHHWLSDVLVGAAVGTASGFAGAALSGRPVAPHPR
jgi:membrane-associated phospholipid phosphatase